MENEIAQVLDTKVIGAGLATIGMLGAALGVGNIFASAVEGIARNPAAEGKIRGLAIIGGALAEGLGILAFVLAAIMIFT